MNGLQGKLTYAAQDCGIPVEAEKPCAYNGWVAEKNVSEMGCAANIWELGPMDMEMSKGRTADEPRG